VVVVISYFSPPEILLIGLINKFFQNTIVENITWRYAYLRGLEDRGVVTTNRGSFLRYFDWKEAFWKKYRLTSTTTISDIFLLKDGDFVGEIRFVMKGQNRELYLPKTLPSPIRNRTHPTCQRRKNNTCRLLSWIGFTSCCFLH